MLAVNVEQMLARMNFDIERTTGSDGSMFLDAFVKTDRQSIVNILREFLLEVFGVYDNSELTYFCYGFQSMSIP